MYRKITKLYKYDVTCRELVDKIDEIISMLNSHSNEIDKNNPIEVANNNIDAGDIIKDRHTGAMYVCTHVDLPDFIRYDTRPNRVENARAGYGDFKGETKDFILLIKGGF